MATQELVSESSMDKVEEVRIELLKNAIRAEDETLEIVMEGLKEQMGEEEAKKLHDVVLRQLTEEKES